MDLRIAKHPTYNHSIFISVIGKFPVIITHCSPNAIEVQLHATFV